MQNHHESPRRPSFGSASSEQSRHNTSWSWARPSLNLHRRSSDSPVELDWSPPLSHLGAGAEQLPDLDLDLDDLSYPRMALQDDADHWTNLDPAFDPVPAFAAVSSLDVEGQGRPEDTPAGGRLKSNDTVPVFSFSQPASLIDHLITIFFAEIHGLLPIFERSRLESSLQLQLPGGTNDNDQDNRYHNLSFEAAFVLNGMLSLAARFSNSPFFTGQMARDRGEIFAQQARELYEKFALEKNKNNLTPNLTYLQGCILLAFYSMTSVPESFAWLLTGTCIRLAYDLELHRTDAEAMARQSLGLEPWTSAEDWASKEERRRAWWSVWELDSFVSTLSCRPYAIDQGQMHVFLPAPDTNWGSKTPIASAAFNPDISVMWKCLQACGGSVSNERAWFLVAKALMLQAHTMFRNPTASETAIDDLETALSCLRLVLPEAFDLDSGVTVTRFDQDNVSAVNWVIHTHILLQRFVLSRPSPRPPHCRLDWTGERG
ncbi:hypothetical protein A1O3_08673 [Capronia epimyces CBS 606.96]|uniref:Xylanolytic transcriptional activator regulatory domain-containing protein n=1 Tax=Capronia epimyces CBS 606.96 TaxID=1182542 RepID=W9XF83_9EURO|nr:uncharacterized protein A1O3_08673 [Capronia epimyces CBS 606.96]EXJ79172.1 hypothetical protein A1O3_08673 [Capronia epimyces CBS 606.96]